MVRVLEKEKYDPNNSDVSKILASLPTIESWQNKLGIGGGLAFTTVEKNLGSIPRNSGFFTITGLSGLTVGKPVMIQQAVGPYTGKGTLPDECEMDGLTVRASVTAADAITAYWNSATFVKGNFKFNYFIGT